MSNILSKEDAILMVEQAQSLLDTVYSHYGDIDTELGRSLSVADTCIESVLEYLGN